VKGEIMAGPGNANQEASSTPGFSIFHQVATAEREAGYTENWGNGKEMQLTDI